MSKPLSITVPHQLGRIEARRRVEEGMLMARSRLGAVASSIDDSWNEDQLDFRVVAMSQTVTGKVEVADDSVTMEVQLPWALAMLADKVRDRVTRQGQLLLGPKV